MDIKTYIPISTDKMAECNKCKEKIEWKKLGDRWIPMNLSGSCHFDTCPFRIKYKNISRDYIEMNKPNLKEGQKQLVEFLKTKNMVNKSIQRLE